MWAGLFLRLYHLATPKGGDKMNYALLIELFRRMTPEHRQAFIEYAELLSPQPSPQGGEEAPADKGQDPAQSE